MMEEFMLIPSVFLERQTTTKIWECNIFTERHGLSLSQEDIQELIMKRKEALESNGRIEFGGGVLQKLIIEFADSPFLYQEIYQETLAGLLECFYYFKNESMEILSDDELIRLMKRYYDDVCQGSLEYLNTSLLENYCRDVRNGTNEYRETSGYEDNYVDFLDWDRDE